MNKKLMISISILLLSVLSSNLFAKIGIIVNKDLYPQISTSLDTYIEDLKAIEGEDVWLEKDEFDDTKTPEDLRSALKDKYDNDDLTGAILIGDLPIAWWYYQYQFETDAYYFDLNGDWTKNNDNQLDDHTGDIECEIWISRITCGTLTDYIDSEADEVNKYFAKVQKRMYGQDPMERKMVVAGQKSIWGGLEREHTDGDLPYTDDNTVTYTGDCGTDWKNALKDGQEFGFVYSHSSQTSHSIGFNLSGIYDNDLKCRFFNSFACKNAAFGYSNGNMVMAYGTSNEGLVAIGSSKSGSMLMGSYHYYYTPLGEDKKSFGEAFKEWYNYDNGISYPYWHGGMNMAGVGTLYLDPYSPVSINNEIVKSTSPVNVSLIKSRIYYSVPDNMNKKESFVRINIYNMKGSLIKTLVNKQKSAGKHYVELNNANQRLAKGLYLCKVEVGELKNSVRIVNK